MQNAFREVCSREGFDEHLEKTLTRIGDIESLGRTREITLKDLWNKGKYKLTTQDPKGSVKSQVILEVENPPEEE
jgi:hypothetical protein